VRIPGGTGPASFASTVEVTGPSGASTLLGHSVLEVPGDCPQPDGEPDETTTTEPTPPGADDVVRVRPRFTG
jgi:hypothetical protein